MKPIRTRSKEKVDRVSSKVNSKHLRGGVGLALAIAFIAFGIVNLVHPLELIVFQATCGKPMFFSCSIPNQPLDPFGARVVGLSSLLLGAALGWFTVFWPRK